MIFVIYLLVACAVVFFSIKCACYVDLLDKKTSLSGAFVGGVILAAVTSLPELATSISAVTIVKNPELIIGNVLGSNLFNLSALAVLILFTTKYFKAAKVSKTHFVTLICSMVAYVLVGLSTVFGLGVNLFTISSTSLLIIIAYAVSIKSMAGDDGEASTEEEDTSPLTVKQVVIRFIAVAIGLVISSIAITYITDIIATKYALNASLAGALFLGVATSLPELTSSITLIKIKNYNATVGNIVGSNMFNFMIMLVGDILVVHNTVYIQSKQTTAMVVFGIIASVFMGIMLILKRNNSQKKGLRGIYGACAGAIVACYVGFLVFSM